MRKFKTLIGAVCGTMAAIGMILCVLATEFPVMPSFIAWRIVGLALVCMGVWPMAVLALMEADR